jgi:hypothetical protein
MTEPLMPACSSCGKLEVAGPRLLASKYHRFRLITRSFRVTVATGNAELSFQLLTPGQCTHRGVCRCVFSGLRAATQL